MQQDPGQGWNPSRQEVSEFARAVLDLQAHPSGFGARAGPCSRRARGSKNNPLDLKTTCVSRAQKNQKVFNKKFTQPLS